MPTMLVSSQRPVDTSKVYLLQHITSPILVLTKTGVSLLRDAWSQNKSGEREGERLEREREISEHEREIEEGTNTYNFDVRDSVLR